MRTDDRRTLLVVHVRRRKIRTVIEGTCSGSVNLIKTERTGYALKKCFSKPYGINKIQQEQNKL